MATQVRTGIDAPLEGGKGWAEAGMDGAKAAYGETSAAIGEGWQELTATIGKLFGWEAGHCLCARRCPRRQRLGAAL